MHTGAPVPSPPFPASFTVQRRTRTIVSGVTEDRSPHGAARTTSEVGAIVVDAFRHGHPICPLPRPLFASHWRGWISSQSARWSLLRSRDHPVASGATGRESSSLGTRILDLRQAARGGQSHTGGQPRLLESIVRDLDKQSRRRRNRETEQSAPT